MILNSYAKLNLYLEIVSKRKDGYHNLVSLFERISLCDKITLKLRKDSLITISSDSNEIPNNADNLAFRSAKLIQDTLKIKNGVDIRIKKLLPVGSGMGGGSSNAASVILGLNKLWKLNLNKKKLSFFARKIGADVSFFIFESPFALIKGIGDKIKVLDEFNKIRFWHVLVVPKIHVSTPLIYNKWDESFLRKPGLTRPRYSVKMLTLAIKQKDFSLVGKYLYNSLEKTATRYFPEIQLVKDRLLHSGLKTVLMSGSGPAVFVLVPSKKQALSLSMQLKKEYRNWRVYVARTI